MGVKKVKGVKALNTTVRVKKMGYIEEHMSIERRGKNSIRILNANEYIDLETGEVKQIKHTENRSESYESIRRTMVRILEVINTNITEPKKTMWVTLTYSQPDGDPMTDTKRLYNDFKKYWQRFLYYTERMGYWQEVKPEYIAIAEPQGTGSWHIHAFIIWADKPPFIANDEKTFEKMVRERYSAELTMCELWGQGYTKTKQVRDTTNPGAYFTAYLADMPQDEVEALPPERKNQVLFIATELQEKEFIDEQGNKKKKKFVKGARLVFYPPKFNIIRTSRGIKEPDVYHTSQKIAKEQVQGAILTYSATYEVTDETGNVVNRISKAYYNHKSVRCQIGANQGTPKA